MSFVGRDAWKDNFCGGAAAAEGNVDATGSLAVVDTF